MRLKLKHLAPPLLAAALLAALALGGRLRARADFTAGGPGAVIAVSTNANVVFLPGQKGGNLWNCSGVTVYLGWDARTVAADKTAADGKTFINAGDAVRIPKRVDHFAMRTAGDGVGVVQYLED